MERSPTIQHEASAGCCVYEPTVVAQPRAHTCTATPLRISSACDVRTLRRTIIIRPIVREHPDLGTRSLGGLLEGTGCRALQQWRTPPQHGADLITTGRRGYAYLRRRVWVTHLRRNTAGIGEHFPCIEKFEDGGGFLCERVDCIAIAASMLTASSLE